MKKEVNIKELLSYFNSIEDSELALQEEAVATAYQNKDDDQSMAIKVLSVFGGFLASIFFIGFLFVAGIGESAVSQVVVGSLLIIGAIWVYKQHNTILIDTISISCFITGFALTVFGLDQLGLTENTISMISILIAFLTLIIAGGYILSLVSILTMNASVLTLITFNNNFDLVHIHVAALSIIVTLVFLKEARVITASKALSKIYNPVRVGLVLSFLSGLVVLGNKGNIPLSTNYIWTSSIIIIAAIAFLLHHLLQTLKVNNSQHKLSIYTICFLLLLPTAFFPAISGAILIILLSFLVNYKTGFAIGVIAFIYFISQYYYDLNLTLLTKSILLFTSGVLFTILYVFVHKKFSSDEKA